MLDKVWSNGQFLSGKVEEIRHWSSIRENDVFLAKLIKEWMAQGLDGGQTRVRCVLEQLGD